MRRVKLTTSFPEWPLFRQTPGGRGLWDDCQFISGESCDECDVWVVYDDLPRAAEALCRSGSSILYIAEPPTIRRYEEKFLAQFDLVISNYSDVPHPRVWVTHPASPWHIGRAVSGGQTLEFRSNFESLQISPTIPRKPDISVIISTKDYTEGHRQRLRFVEQAKTALGERLDVFGRGITEIEDKWDVIAGYAYHLVLENSVFSNYWTEKLADCFLGEAFPFYAGCPNIHEFFPTNSLGVIDISDPAKSIQTIMHGLESSLSYNRQEAVRSAKNLVLFQHNLFAVLAEAVDLVYGTSMPRAINLYPATSFSHQPSVQEPSGEDRWRLPKWFMPWRN